MIVPYTRVPAPTLKINELLGQPKGSRALEQLIAANLLAHLDANGWKVVAVDDGEQLEPMTTATEALELVFDLDISTVKVAKGTHTHVVQLVCGNGEDLISDWTMARDDADGFAAVMEAFDADEFVQ